MTLAAIGAVALGHVGEAATLAFLFSLSETLEERAMSRARAGLRALLELIPDAVCVLRGGREIVIKAADVRIGDLLQVGAGERIATDGTVIEGRSSLDTSAVTGESIPVDVGPSSQVSAGSINGSGTLRIEATADGRDNSLTQIVALVEQAQTRKGQRARLADRIARPLVPVVLIGAILVAAYGLIVGDVSTWVERALVVLVSASPCALAIAVPVTVIAAVGSASRFGGVIKSGAAFERLGEIRTVALDKTGTLTRNQPSVVEVAPAPGQTPARVIQLAAALEATSTHPLAQAITQPVTPSPSAADGVVEPDSGLSGLAGGAPVHGGSAPWLPPDLPAANPLHLTPPPQAADVVEEPGCGLFGLVGGIPVRVGNTRWLPPGPLGAKSAEMAARGMTVVAVEAEGQIAGLIGLRDELRPEASETVGLLRRLGIEIAMLTGDNARTAQALAAQAGITQVHAEQMPADKADVIVELNRRGPTAMVGDGINDAPALATATVGIAMGLKGSAAAIESADVAFTGEDLRLLVRALAHARRGRRIMTANIGLSLVIITALVPLALFGVIGLAGAVLVHECAEVLVILNGLRAASRRAITRQSGSTAA
ncbi:MAG: cation-translocating P-type ATPase [Bifidobacteriaceae bacterium]|nr:cation-translocating P-type ATPase [Bifidobacteriaceae bacterium]